MPIIIDFGESKKIDYDSDDSYEAKKRRKGGSKPAVAHRSSNSNKNNNNNNNNNNVNAKEKNENQNNARDMEDVLNLKVYRVKIKTKPFYIDPTKVNFEEKKAIGAQDAVEDEDLILRLNEPAIDIDGDGIPDLTVMQRIKQEKSKNYKFIDKVKASQASYFEKCYSQTRMIKTGQKIVIENPSIYEVIDWAVTFVNSNEDTIKYLLLEFHEMAVKRGEEQEKGSSGKRSPAGVKFGGVGVGVGGTGPSSPSLSKKSTGVKMPLTLQADQQGNKIKGVSYKDEETNGNHRRKYPVQHLAHQLDALEFENRAAFVHAITMKPLTPTESTQDLNKLNRNNNARKQSSSHLSSVSSASIMAPHSMIPAPPQVSKSSKANNIRRGSSVSSTTVGEFVDASTAATVTTGHNEKKLTVSEKIVEDNEDDESKSKSKSTANDNGENEKSSKTGRKKSEGTDATATVAAAAILVESEDNGALIIKINSDSHTAHANAPNQNNTQTPNESSNEPTIRVDSSSSKKASVKGQRVIKAAEEAAVKVTIGSAKYTGNTINGEVTYDKFKNMIPMSAQREIDYQEAQVLNNMKMVTYELRRRKGNMQALCEDMRGSFDKFDTSTKQVIDHWANFNSAMDNCSSSFKTQCIDHKFNRDSKLSTKMTLIDWDNLSNKGVIFEMRKLSHLSDIATQNSYLTNIAKESWFTKGLTGLNELSRKTNNQLPLSCVKFLVVIQMCLQRGHQITQKSFYILLEKTLERADHIQLIVHRAIKFVREAVSIGPETFFRYLESNNIQPCPELLTQIRNNKKNRDKRFTKIKRTNSNSRQSLQMSGTQSFKSIDEMSEDDRISISTPIKARGGLLNTNEDIYTVASSDNLSEKSEDDFSDS